MHLGGGGGWGLVRQTWRCRHGFRALPLAGCIASYVGRWVADVGKTIIFFRHYHVKSHAPWWVGGEVDMAVQARFYRFALLPFSEGREPNFSFRNIPELGWLLQLFGGGWVGRWVV